MSPVRDDIVENIPKRTGGIAKVGPDDEVSRYEPHDTAVK
jgi:hypothetical protein